MACLGLHCFEVKKENANSAKNDMFFRKRGLNRFSDMSDIFGKHWSGFTHAATNFGGVEQGLRVELDERQNRPEPLTWVETRGPPLNTGTHPTGPKAYERQTKRQMNTRENDKWRWAHCIGYGAEGQREEAEGRFGPPTSLSALGWEKTWQSKSNHIYGGSKHFENVLLKKLSKLGVC